MEAIAKTRHLKGSPRKARLVIDLIRGRNVSQALAILKFTDKRAAAPIAKTLRSAIANATYKAEQQNIAIDPDDLWVKTCFVDMGVHKNRRRMRPAPQGRAYREQRHYCHITILVSSDEQPVKDIKAKKGGKEGDKSANEKPKAAKPAAKAERRDAAPEVKSAPQPEAPVEETTATAAAPEASEATLPETTETVETREAAAPAESPETTTDAAPKAAADDNADTQEEEEKK